METELFRKLFANLPPDPELAFIELSQRAAALADEISDDNSIDIKELVAVVERFAGKFQIRFIGKGDNESWRDQIRYLSGTIAYEIAENHRVRIAEAMVDGFLDDYANKMSNSPDFGEAILEDTEKSEIRAKLNEIREKIDNSALPRAKKNSLFDKINKLNAELDRYGTRTDSFMGFALDISVLGKAMHKNMKPIIQDVKDILHIIYVGRAKAEGVQLPAPEDLPQIPGPLD